jgi:S1-C subfamily serine protease
MIDIKFALRVSDSRNDIYRKRIQKMQINHRSRRILLWLALLLPVFALACRTLVPGSEVPTQVIPPTPVHTTTVPIVVNSEFQVASEDQVLVDLYQRVNPSVVNITVYGEDGGQILSLGQGSVFVYDPRGYIVTNAHVVYGASQLEVTFSDGLTRPAEVVGEDLHSDLAVISVELPPGIGAIPLGDMNELAVGQTVVAIGNPFGLQGTLTRGIISALGRTIPALTIFSIPQAIQTDAAINPGNSGGPLLNLDGEVIGVNAQIETGGTTNSNMGVGFAIPVSIIQRVVPSLIENGAYTWPWLGVTGNDVTPILVQAMDLPVERGAYMIDIIEGGPASKAGLQGVSQPVTVDGRQVEIGGDVITAIDGIPVNTFDDVLVYIALQTSPGQTVNLTILRDGKYQDIPVQLEPRPVE